MKIYSKRLKNVDELEREKLRLERQLARLEEEDVFSMEGIMEGFKSGEAGSGGAWWMNFIPTDNPIVSRLIKMVVDRFTKGKPDADEDDEEPADRKKPKKNILKTVAVEVIGGYLKWKAIELSFKGIRHIIKNRKNKKADY